MIKRFLVTMILALSVLSMSYADIKLKDVGNGQVEITFTYKDSSSEMGVIGSFDNWTVPGEAMTKNAAGLWETTIKAAATDEITYKFYSKGTWIQDDNAPDHKDDGFGGKNGLIVVADILSGVTPASPVAAAPTIGATAGPPVAKTYNSKLLFGMYTVLGSQTIFSTQSLDKKKKGLETNTTGLYGTSYWKLDGTLMPGVRTFINIKAFDGTKPVWAQSATGVVDPNFNKGASNLAGGLLSNPINYFGAVNPSIDSLKTTVETPYVVWETAYVYAKPTDHSGFLWTTLYQQNANNGYMRFDLGKSAQKWGDVTVDATFAPNKMTDYFGVFSWVDVTYADTKLEFQYDAKSAQKALVTKMFDKFYQQDYLIGAKTTIGNLKLVAQGLMNRFSEAAYANTSDLAGEVKATWSLADDVLGVAAGYRYTGDQATMLFGNNDDSVGNTTDQFGTKGTQRFLANAWGKPVDTVKIGADTNLILDNATPAAGGKSYYGVYGKPYVEFTLDQIIGKKSSLKSYVKMNYALRSGFVNVNSQKAFNLTEVGSKYYMGDPIPNVMKGLDVTYGLNGGEKDKMLNTLLASMTFVDNLNVQAGLGLRVVRDYASQTLKDTNNLVGFSLGTSWRVPVSEIRNPLLYGAFVYNMDPYDGNTANLKLNDYVTDGGAAKSDGLAQLRVMMKWDF